MQMKQLIILTMLLFASWQGNSQNITGNHCYRIGDNVEKQIVAYAAEAEDAQPVVWDIRDMEICGGKHSVSYTEVYGKEQLVAGIENNTLHYYEQAHDSLLAWGYENNLTKTVYNRPMMLLHTPLVYGKQHSGLFHGRMAYCERMFSRVCGSWTVKVDGTGMLLLPGGDTLRHVSRVHIREMKAVRHYPHISTDRELKAYVDSIAPYTTDSIIAAMQDSMLTMTDTYRWYAAGYRYPILETVTAGNTGQQPQSSIAYYCPPENQELLADTENENVRELLAEAVGQGAGGERQSPMSRCDVSVHGQTVKVNFDLTEDATVKGLISNVSGIMLRQQSRHHEAGRGYEMELDCSGLSRGEYVLYMNVNGIVESYTVSL